MQTIVRILNKAGCIFIHNLILQKSLLLTLPYQFLMLLMSKEEK